ncbi:MAG: S41 family peptidase, partial [Phycisphaerae bacterium]|nr:S41 family peptidase [Phycisphaerae bacterium]
MSRQRAFVQGLLVTTVGAVALAAGMGFSNALNLSASARTTDYAFLDPIIDVHSTLANRYISPIDDKALQQAAINGMIEALNDPYTQYVPPVARNDFAKELLGEYVGIGAQIITQDQWLTIVSPLEDSPAIRAGLMPGDRIREIDGVSTFGKTDVECVQILTGEPGTPVKLLVERKGEQFTLDIIRDQIKTRSVKGVHRDEAEGTRWHHLIDTSRSIAYIRLTQFTPRCAEEVAEALASVGADKGKLRGLVLDLRGNPGGVLAEAERIADLFLPSGVIVSTRGRAVPEKITRASAPGTHPDYPIAVLINGSSASASEVLAGALVENNRAIAVGSRTFGKGSVQSVETLRHARGAQLKFTEQGYYLPSGRSITRKDDSAQWGVDPTDGFFVPITDKELLELLRVRREEEVIRTRDPADDDKNWSDPDWIVSYLKDPQLAAALKAVQVRADSGSWQPTGQPGITHTAVTLAELQRLEITRDRINRELGRIDNRIAALATAAEGATTTPRPDLIPDGVTLSGGQIRIYDKDGALVTTLRLTDENLERWLMDAGVEKIEDRPAPEPTPEAATKHEIKPDATKPDATKPDATKPDAPRPDRSPRE